MIIKLKEISIRELTECYEDHSESGVRAYGGQPDVRPPFQREFVYNEKQLAIWGIYKCLSLYNF